MTRPTAAVLTISDGVSGGTRADGSGDAAQELLAGAGFDVAIREVVPDERAEIERTLVRLAASHTLVVTTGGTGFGPRDVTPEATKAVLEREAPGLSELMRAAGLAHTPMAALSRGTAGTIGDALVINLPGIAEGRTRVARGGAPGAAARDGALGGRDGCPSRHRGCPRG